MRRQHEANSSTLQRHYRQNQGLRRFFLALGIFVLIVNYLQTLVKKRKINLTNELTNIKDTLTINPEALPKENLEEKNIRPLIQVLMILIILKKINLK